MADVTNPKKGLADIKDVNLLEKGVVKIFYDNDGYMLEVIWFNGYSHFTETEHEDVLVMVAMEDDAYGFMIHDADWISDGLDGYVTVNLKSRLEKYANAPSPNGQANEQSADGTGGGWCYNPIELGIINVRYDRDKHYCDVFWAIGDTRYTETENENLLALVDIAGDLLGFRIINTDRLKENPKGVLSANLKIKMEISPSVQAGDNEQ